MCLRCLETICHAKESDTEKVQDCGNTRIGQLVKGEARLFAIVTGEAVSGNCELVLGCTHSQQSPKQPGRVT